MYVPGRRKVRALILWCLCYQIAADLFFNLLSTATATTNSTTNSTSTSTTSRHNRHAILYANAAEYASFAAADEAPFEATTGAQTEINQAPLTPGHEIKLTCHIPQHPNVEFSWSRIRLLPQTTNADPYAAPMLPPSTLNEEPLVQGDPRFIINKQELIIRSPTYDDIGDYFCKVKSPHDEVDGKKMIAVRVRPYIHDFALMDSTFKSAIVNEGARLIIPCNVTDDYYPNITITWHMSKFDEEDMIDINHDQDGILIQVHNATSNALVFERITQEHRRFYKCRVSNGIIDNSRVILIRVKNQFTFFWPLVGIVIELVILLGVICVVQKKRVEPDADSHDRKAIQM